MDAFHRLHPIKNQEEIITFNDNDNSNSLQSVNEHHDENLPEEFAKCFSIDNDDVVLLDQSQVILYEVKSVLNNLVNDVLKLENPHSQINNLSNKRSLDFNNQDGRLSNKKVRFNLSDEDKQQQQQLLTSLFISETIQCTNPSKPYAQFLYNLGLDLCLEQTLPNENFLTEIQKQTLIQRNQVFHPLRIYSCKYCSFQTNTIHVLNHHYRTPHIVPNIGFPHHKYRCTYCSFQTFRIPLLRRHFGRKHGYLLVADHSLARYACPFCYYETDDKTNFTKHNSRCQIEQTRTRLANNLLAPLDQLNRNTTVVMQKNKNQSTMKHLPTHSTLNTMESVNDHQIMEPILIESDHDTSSISRTSSSDEDFIVSSDEESSSSGEEGVTNDRDLEIPGARPRKIPQLTFKSTTSLTSYSIPTSAAATLSSLSKLLLLNGTPMSSFTLSSSPKSSLVSIQPKPATQNDIYQMCNICQCYIYKKDYIKHMNEKHHTSSMPAQQSMTTHATILNNTMNSINTTTTCLTPTLVVTKATPPPPPPLPSTIFLLSTTTMDPQSITLNMIKCPWCDTNFEHIDVMTGHLMRYHRMTLAAAKVVVAEQMKIQGASSSQLTIMFKDEIERIQKDFTDKIYWKLSQPKVYLHQIDNLSCFVCKIIVDDIVNHFLSLHQIQLGTMNTIKQCCLCGLKCDKKNTTLFEHQLRTHAGVCYSSVLKQFIRFEPPPLPKTTILKDHTRLPLPSSSSSSSRRSLTTYTEKKFGCRKCATSSRLFTFEELTEHLRLNHELNVNLHRRCIICQQTYTKGNEYNQHCLEHLNDENPSIEIKRQRML